MSKRVDLLPNLHNSQHNPTHRQTVLGKAAYQVLLSGSCDTNTTPICLRNVALTTVFLPRDALSAKRGKDGLTMPSYVVSPSVCLSVSVGGVSDFWSYTLGYFEPHRAAPVRGAAH